MRVTRAALRAQQIHEDDVEDDAVTTPGQSSKTPTAGVLQDITRRNAPASVDAVKTPQAQQSSPVACDEQDTSQTESVNQTIAQLLTPKAPKTPKSDPAINKDFEKLQIVDETDSIAEIADVSVPPKTPKTPKFDPAVHKELEQLESGDKTNDAREDSFVEHIIARSPSKIIPRIEDSVDAMDALEDAIEKVAEGLPTITELDMQSPIRKRKSTPKPTPNALPELTPSNQAPRGTSNKTPRKTQPGPRKRASPLKSQTVQKGVPSSQVAAKPTIPLQNGKRSSAVFKAAMKPMTRPVSISSRKVPAKAQGDVSSPRSPAKALPTTMQKRKTSTTLSTSKPGFIPAKSTKPTTTSTFVLPGEVIAAKFKAQKEERMRKEEEAAEQNKKEFKARPAPMKNPRHSIVPRETKTSRARMSVMASGKENVEHAIPAKAAKAATKRNTLSIPKSKPEPSKANSAIRRATIVPRVASLTTSTTTIPAKEEARLSPEVLRAQAKKARDEAAEKGRLASREWAERQKKRAMDQTGVKAKNAPEEAVPIVAP